MDDLRSRLIDVGTHLLEADGLNRLTLRRIASAANVSHGAPRHYFATYESLLAEIARGGLEDLDRRLDPHFTSAVDSDRSGQLLGLASSYLDFAEQRPQMFALVTRHDLLDGAGGELRTISSRWFTRLTRLMFDNAAAALAFWSSVHGLAVLSAQRTAEPLGEHLPDSTEVLHLLASRLLG